MNDRQRERVQVTMQGRDCDDLPRVPNAGAVLTSEGGRPYQLMHNGIKLYSEGHYGDVYTEVIKGLRGFHEPQQEKAFHEVLQRIQPNGTMIELGSYWAYYSLWFNQAIAGAVNYMVEPSPQHLQDGRDNFALNKRTGQFIHACIGREPLEETTITYRAGQTCTVRQISLDSFLDAHVIDFVDILHADVQGVEYEMLQGGQQALKNGRIGYLLISTHGPFLHKDCLQFLRKNDCTILAEHDSSDSYSVDGLIVAATKAIVNPSPIAISYRHSTQRKKRVQNWYESYAPLPTLLRSTYRKIYWGVVGKAHAEN
ncbi:MAG: FkbM family methyltransferase [Candidatus Promineifilaceae bacterium]